MDLKNLKKKKIKKKPAYSPVRIKSKLYNKIKKISDDEEMSIIKITEFLLESAVDDYQNLKNNKKIKNNEKNEIQEDLLSDLILNLLMLHEENILEYTKNNEEMKDKLIKSLNNVKEIINDRIKK